MGADQEHTEEGFTLEQQAAATPAVTATASTSAAAAQANCQTVCDEGVARWVAARRLKVPVVTCTVATLHMHWSLTQPCRVFCCSVRAADPTQRRCAPVTLCLATSSHNSTLAAMMLAHHNNQHHSL